MVFQESPTADPYQANWQYCRLSVDIFLKTHFVIGYGKTKADNVLDTV